MAVHLRPSAEAQGDASVLLLSSNNVLSPATGRPYAKPTQDVVLGVCLLTAEHPGAVGTGRSFTSSREALLAHDAGGGKTCTPICMHYSGPMMDLETAQDSQDIRREETVHYRRQQFEATAERVILNERLPDQLPFINGLINKRGLGQLVAYCYLNPRSGKTVQMLEFQKDTDFRFATRSGP